MPQPPIYFGPKGGGGGGGGSGYSNVDRHTITGPEAAAKQFTLSGIPDNASLALVFVIGGAPVAYALDYLIAGNVFSWNGLNLDGLLAAGDIVEVAFSVAGP